MIRPALPSELIEGARVVYRRNSGALIDGTITSAPTFDDGKEDTVCDVKLDHHEGENWGYLDQFLIEEPVAAVSA